MVMYLNIGENKIEFDTIISYEIKKEKVYYAKVYEYNKGGFFATLSMPYVWNGLKKEINKSFYEDCKKIGEYGYLAYKPHRFLKTSSGEIKEIPLEYIMTKEDVWYEETQCLYIKTKFKLYKFTEGKEIVSVKKIISLIEKYKVEKEEEQRKKEKELYELELKRIELKERELALKEKEAGNQRQMYHSDAKNNNYGERGEQEVEYALKWLSKEDYLVIEKKSIGKNNQKSIILHNSEFIDEDQEDDHIVIGHQGVFLIETKNYNGKIIINKDGNWIRIKDGIEVGERNPLQQIKRHEKLVKSIIGSVPVCNIICLSHPKVIIEGMEYCPIKILKSDLLCEYMESFSSNINLTREQMEQLSLKIYSHMKI